MKPPRRCHDCAHWNAFPVDGKCCTDLAVVMARQAEGQRLRDAARMNAPAPSMDRDFRPSASVLLSPAIAEATTAFAAEPKRDDYNMPGELAAAAIGTWNGVTITEIEEKGREAVNEISGVTDAMLGRIAMQGGVMNAEEIEEKGREPVAVDYAQDSPANALAKRYFTKCFLQHWDEAADASITKALIGHERDAEFVAGEQWTQEYLAEVDPADGPDHTVFWRRTPTNTIAFVSEREAERRGIRPEHFDGLLRQRVMSIAELRALYSREIPLGDVLEDFDKEK